jgi:putative ABC transport system permease protein
MVSAPALRTKLRRDLGRRRAQFAAVILTLFLGIGLFVTSYDAFLNLKTSYAQLYSRTRFADLQVTGGDLTAVGASARSLGALVTERSVADVPLRLAGNELLGRIVGMPANAEPDVDRVMILHGSYLAASRRDGVLLEQHAASHFHLAPGDHVQVLTTRGWRRLTVRGVVASPEYLWPARSRQDLITTPDDFAVLFVPQALVPEAAATQTSEQLLAYLPDRDRVDPFVTELAAEAHRHGATEVLTMAEQPSNAALQEDVQGFNEMALLFPILFLSGAAMAAWVLLTRLVQSQRSQIGTLRAFGASRHIVLAHYLSFGLAAALIGSVPGAAAGAVGAQLATGSYTRAISVPITVTPLHPTTLVIGIVFGLVVGALAAGGPALAASRVPPAEAMRGLLPSPVGDASGLERAIPWLRRIPVSGRMALRGISRNRRRTVYTVLGVVLALVLVLVSWGMLDTTQVLLARQFNQIQRQDAQVYLTGPVTPDAIVRLAAVRGVAAAEPAAELPVTISSQEGTYSTSLVALLPHTTMHGFLSADGGTTSLPTSGLLLGVALRSRLGIQPGGEVRITLPSLGTLPERVASFVSEPLGTFAYTALPSLEQSLASTGAVSPPVLAGANPLANTVLLRFSAGSDASVMKERISALPTVAAYVDSRALQREARSLMGLFYALVGLMLVFGGLLAFALVFNTMSVNVAERSVEVATLRSEGVRLRRISRLIASENLLLVAIGIPLGLVAGYFVAKGFMSSFSSDLFSFALAMQWTTFVIAAIAMLVVGLVTQWPSLRAIRRIEIATVLRERAG